jgi:hypothetical protein
MRHAKWLVVLAAGALSACAGGQPALTPARSLECVPFARALTGVELHGDAPDWWAAAEGRYRRSRTPKVGAVLVFRRTSRLPHGHVSVVSEIVSAQQIRVTHANWVHGRVTPDDAVDDVSRDHDWSTVRVWWQPASQMGATIYPVYGFILPDRRLSHDAIIGGAARAARLAVDAE